MMAPENVTIRPATTTDAEAIARVDIASWRGAYSESLSDAHLASLDVEARAGQWTAAVTANDTSVLVAEDETGPIGFTSVAPSRDQAAEPGPPESYRIA